MTSSVFFASSNPHKIREFQEIFAAVLPGVQLLTLLDRPQLAREVAETGSTYQDNALLKAQAYAQALDLPVVTDDSGVDVAAFPGLLGVRSARWLPGSDADRLQGLLQRLAGQPNRRLTYHAVICYLAPGQPPRFFAGQLAGQAAFQPGGQAGFGYDPIMIPDGFQQTLSQLPPASKNAISHRRQAIERLAQYLRDTATLEQSML